MKTTFTPGSRFVKDGRALHIKQVCADKVLTSRGIKTFSEMAAYTHEAPKQIKPVSAKLTADEKAEMERLFPSAAAAIRYAISEKGGRK